ncbi:hypothetical protein K488DRAFT_44311 [Vararia minispora EC-137]|uniref:Uncharacterized protein n=1 Tax=Vararia minispora EC-137 TaxID=1314806 RepID=A0ACB8QU84_9AGAM|nr:hypothetical protein K488DRAFT_44311 [Vararia minispora EC-137]
MNAPNSAYVNKWSAGADYGPVLTQTDLYLLKPKVQINPILTREGTSFSVVFDIATGSATGFNDQSPGDFPFTQGAEPATLPRMKELYIISPESPWCTTVRNDGGVTLQDVFSAVWKDYTEHPITDAEIAACPPRVQEVIKRYSMSSQQAAYQIYSPAPPRLRRIGESSPPVDWLRDRHMFDSMSINDVYAEQRLGFSAPNVLFMRVANY